MFGNQTISVRVGSRRDSHSTHTNVRRDTAVTD